MNRQEAVEKMFDEFTSEWEGYLCNMCGITLDYKSMIEHLMYKHSDKARIKYLKDPESENYMEKL